MTDVDVAQEGSDGLPLTIVRSERIRLVFAPSRGGRLLSLRVDGHELLWQNPDLLTADLRPAVPVAEWPKGDGEMSTWANVGGSKTWPAPQGWGGEGEWPGPPDPVLDSGVWELDVAGDAEHALVTMTSADDPRTGLRIERRFRIPAEGLGFAEEITFTNTATRPVRWSIWEVCQVDTSAGSGLGPDVAAVIVPASGDSRSLDLGTWFGAADGARSADGIRLPVGTAVAKRGFADVPGTVSYIGPDGAGISLHQPPVAGATYPDGGAQVEVWLQTPTPDPIAELGDLHPAADLVELELLAPLVTLGPGESSTASIDWVVTPPLWRQSIA